MREEKRPQNCGTGYCSCIECVMEPKPVAWMNDEMDCIFFDAERPEPFDFDFWKPLYTTPPQRTWVGLTREEAKEICLANRPYVVDMVIALEAELKKRNGFTDEENT